MKRVPAHHSVYLYCDFKHNDSPFPIVSAFRFRRRSGSAQHRAAAPWPNDLHAEFFYPRHGLPHLVFFCPRYHDTVGIFGPEPPVWQEEISHNSRRGFRYTPSKADSGSRSKATTPLNAIRIITQSNMVRNQFIITAPLRKLKSPYPCHRKCRKIAAYHKDREQGRPDLWLNGTNLSLQVKRRTWVSLR